MRREAWPIIVGGCHRSGTSLVRRLLDAHPRIHCGPEVPFFRDLFGAYLDDPLRHLRFSTNARSLVPETELLRVLGGAFVELHERAARRAGKARWADKAPENVLFTDEWELLLQGSWLFVHVVRNPLDTLASIEESPFPLTIPAALADRIAFYRRYTEGGLRFGVQHPDRYRRLVYEELAESPRPVLEELMAWLGEDFHAGQLSLAVDPDQGGLEDPKVARTTRIHADSVHRWRRTLDDHQAKSIWGETEDLWAEIDPDRRWLPEASSGPGLSI